MAIVFGSACKGDNTKSEHEKELEVELAKEKAAQAQAEAEKAKVVAGLDPKATAPAPDSVAIALVFNGQEIWVGNDDVEKDKNAQYEGALKNLEAAIDKAQLATAGGAGSKLVAVSYSTGAEIKLPTLDLSTFSGKALGSQADYRGKIGTDMGQGIEMAQAELSKVTAARKAVIVVGDGCDTNPEEAKHQLPHLKKELGKQNVQMFAIIYKSAVSCEASVITMIAPGAKTVKTTDEFARELTAILAKIRAG